MIIPEVTLQNLASVLEHDNKVKVAGVDVDGVLRGKIISKSKFLSSAKGGFGLSSAIFSWDVHDELYTTELSIASKETGYDDFIAVPDLASYRRIPWDDNIAFFLLEFFRNGERITPDPRGLMKSVRDKLAAEGVKAMAGVELEFVNYVTPGTSGYSVASAQQPPNLAGFLQHHQPSDLRSISEGMFGYSISRPTMNKAYFNAIYNTAETFRCPIEGWHTESGAGAYEAALAFCPAEEMADRVTLFKYLSRSLGTEHGITPNFMAKPAAGLPGNSGHIHVSLADLEGKNLFARDTPDTNANPADMTHLSDLGRSFIAGILEALPDILVLLAPTINSYKRLVENFWAPVFISWGLEDRIASLRLITPPTCCPSATRLEIRVPGADLPPHYAIAALVLAGWRGVQRKLPLTTPPMSQFGKDNLPPRLANDLGDALKIFAAPSSIARELFSDAFVDHFAGTRRHEIDLYKRAVTDWEFKRYIETI